MGLTFTSGLTIGSGLALSTPSIPVVTGSLNFNGTNQFLTNQSNSTNLQAGTGDFTLEFWMYPTSVASTSVVVELGRLAIGSSAGFQIDVISNVLQIYYGPTIGTNLTGPTVSNNIWYHVALTRSGGSLRLFVNGTQSGSTVTDNTNYSQAYLWIATNAGGSTALFTGKVTNLRMVKGVAVYTSNFTVSTISLATTQSANQYGSPSAAITGTQTSLLMSAATSETALTDSSTNNFSVTGSYTWNAATPFLYYTSSYLVVAGGGGGGVNSSSGGGAGGLLSGTRTISKGTSYSVVVGTGGAGGISPTGASVAAGNAGSNSSFAGLTAIGGGGSGLYTGTGGSGGSGGGGQTGGAGTAGQGNNGGSAVPAGSGASASGGGGAGAVGGVFSGGTFPTTGTSGPGGVGVVSDLITTTQATTNSVGQVFSSQVWFAGGGGGSGDFRGSNGGAGGTGGGGAGSKVAGGVGGAGSPASGGGGGGSSFNSTPQGNGGNGGTGVVIISVPTSEYSGTTTGSPTVVTNGANTVMIFKVNGSYTA